MLEAVWQINNANLRTIQTNGFQIRRSVVEGSLLPVCQAVGQNGALIDSLQDRIRIRGLLIDRIFDVLQESQIAHDAVVNPALPIERRTVALARLQALLRYQRYQNIPVGHVWQIHEVVFTEGFSLEQVQAVIDTLKRICLDRMHSKEKIDVNMVYSILTNLVHLAESLAPVPVDDIWRLYALQALREIMQELPVRYFKVYRQRFQNIVNEAQEGIYTLAQEILDLMKARQHPPKIIEVTEDDD